VGARRHADWTGNWNKQWYGVRRFFEYLESKAYKMHIRVLLSKYRSYTPCGGLRRRAAEAPRRCCGAWAMDARCRAAARRSAILPVGALDARAARSLARACALHDLMQLPIDRLRASSTPDCPARCSTRRSSCCWTRCARA
jgi:excinuclease ABC subunit A